MVEAWIKDGTHRQYETRIVDHLSDHHPQPLRLSRFGGWRSGERVGASGFFRTERFGNRWWLIDPDGYRFLHKAVCSVSPQKGPQFRRAFPGLFEMSE